MAQPFSSFTLKTILLFVVAFVLVAYVLNAAYFGLGLVLEPVVPISLFSLWPRSIFEICCTVAAIYAALRFLQGRDLVMNEDRLVWAAVVIVLLDLVFLLRDVAVQRINGVPLEHQYLATVIHDLWTLFLFMLIGNLFLRRSLTKDLLCCGQRVLRSCKVLLLD